VNGLKKIFFVIIVILLGLVSCEKKTEKKIHRQPVKKTVTTKVKKPQTKIPEKIKPFAFTKGIYLTAYTVHSKKFKPIIKEAVKAGINTVVFDIKNMNGDVFFDNDSRIKYLGKNHKKIVNINKTVRYLHKNGMRAIARIVMFHDQYLANSQDELRPESKKNDYWQESKRKKAWLDSSNPKVQNYLFNIIDLVAGSGVDEIQLDYIRFPTQGNQRDAYFYFQKMDDKKAEKDSLYVKRKREDVIIRFLSKVKKMCRQNNVTLGGDVFAITAWQRKVDISATGQNIKRMTKYLDSIHPMIYPSHFSRNFSFRENIHNEPYYIVFIGTSLTKKSTEKNCRVIPYIQANSWKANYIPDYVYAQIQAVKDAGGKGFILWNASSDYNETFKWLIKKKI